MSRKSRQETLLKIGNLAARLETIVGLQDTALAVSLRGLAKIIKDETGYEPHPADVAAALRELGYECVNGYWVKGA